MEKKNIVFLIGAGAEGNKQIGLPSGSVFKRKTIIPTNISSFCGKINESKDYKIDDAALLHHNATNTLYQTLKEYGQSLFEKTNNECFVDYFTDEEINIIKKYFDYKNKLISDNSEKKEIQNKFLNLYKKIFYNPIKNNEYPKECTDEEKNRIKKLDEIFLEKICFFSDIDSYFNYLRKPDLYINEVTHVMKTYFAAYKCIYDSLYEIANEKPKIPNDRLEMLDEVNRLQDKIIKENKIENLYYRIIKQHKDDFNINVITTNYTNFAEKIIGLENENIAYLHGKLDLFENLKTKKIDRPNNFKNEDVIFPYILIQSGVKPLISPLEIKVFSNACDMIENADYLIILGYGLNSDDEHVVSMIKYYLDKRKDKLEVYNLVHEFEKTYNNDDDDDKNEKFKIDNPIAASLTNEYHSFKNYDCKKLEEILDKFRD